MCKKGPSAKRQHFLAHAVWTVDAPYARPPPRWGTYPVAICQSQSCFQSILASFQTPHSANLLRTPLSPSVSPTNATSTLLLACVPLPWACLRGLTRCLSRYRIAEGRMASSDRTRLASQLDDGELQHSVKYPRNGPKWTPATWRKKEVGDAAFGFLHTVNSNQPLSMLTLSCTRSVVSHLILNSPLALSPSHGTDQAAA